MDTLTPWIAVFGAVGGAIGTLLGILNYRLHHKSQKVLIKIKAHTDRVFSDGKLESISLLIQIANNSHFDITIANIGLCIRFKWYVRLKNVPLFIGFSQSKHKLLPTRISSRDQKEFRFKLREKLFFAYSSTKLETVLKARRIFVETSDGKIFFFRTQELNSFVKTVSKLDTSTLRI